MVFEWLKLEVNKLKVIFLAGFVLFAIVSIFSQTNVCDAAVLSENSHSICGTWDSGALTCTLNNNLTEGIEIETDGITLDCDGHSIVGPGTGYGIYLNYRSGVSVTNCIINDFFLGIHFYYSDSNSFINNVTSNNYAGVYLAVSNSNTIANNSVLDNRHSGIYPVNSANNTIANNNISNNEYGIHLVNYTDHNNSDNNIITDNNISDNSEFGIRFQYSNGNIATGNMLSSNKRGVFIYSASGNKIYHNNFIDNFLYQANGNVFRIFDNGYPIGGNYWSDYSGTDSYSGPNQDQPNSDNIIDIAYTFDDGQDRYPFMEENGWGGQIQLPIISDFGQFESDEITSIIEGATVTENTVVFKATLDDPNDNQVKLQIELRQFEEPFTGADDGGILNSDFVDAGNETIVVKSYLANYQYHWRARAVNSQGGVSGWQEFGEIENVDFIMKAVPLYTQVRSPYPSEDETEEWFDEPYAEGFAGNYDCGWSIADCGCAITSMVMVGRFYDINTGIDNSDTNPGKINDWLNSNGGYSGPNLYWSKAIEYLGYIDDDKKIVKLSFDHYNEPSTSSWIDAYVDNAKPIVAYSNVYGHYFVIDGKSNGIYTIKDPYWYNTKTLNDSKNIANHTQDYNSYFTKANLFSYLEMPKRIAASVGIYLASPAELIVTDPKGRKLGRDPINNIIYDEIPDSSYTAEGAIISSEDSLDEIHEKKVIYIPNPIDGLYDIHVIGTGAGDYTLTSLLYDDGGDSKEIIQEGNIVQNDIQEFELDYSTQDVQQTETYQIVNIDIKPHSRLNIIRIKSWGVTRVAILSDQFFDAREVVINSVLFAGASPLMKRKIFSRWRFRDIDKDGDLDMILYFRNRTLDLNPTDTEAVLTGELSDGTLIKGSDSVRVIDRRYKK